MAIIGFFIIANNANCECYFLRRIFFQIKLKMNFKLPDISQWVRKSIKLQIKSKKVQHKKLVKLEHCKNCFIIQYSKMERLVKWMIFFSIQHFFRFVQPPMPKQIQKKHFLPIINEFLKVGAGSFESGPPTPKNIGSGRQNFWSRS